MSKIARRATKPCAVGEYIPKQFTESSDSWSVVIHDWSGELGVGSEEMEVRSWEVAR